MLLLDGGEPGVRAPTEPWEEPTMSDPARPMPGDLLLTRSKTGVFGRLIRVGAALRDEPNLINHVVIVDHQDRQGTWWGIEGRPGGVGWVDLRRYLGSRWTLVNATQPKTEAQRKIVTKGAAAVLGVAYDWVGIAEDAAGATLPAALTTRIEALWGSDWQGKGPPAHLVCSSLADWLYGSADLTNPNVHPTRNTTPADWMQLWITHGWASPTA